MIIQFLRNTTSKFTTYEQAVEAFKNATGKDGEPKVARYTTSDGLKESVFAIYDYENRTYTVYATEREIEEIKASQSDLEDALKALIDAEEAAREAADDAINDRIDGLDLADVAADNKPVVSVSQADGQVAAAVGTIDAEWVNYENTANAFVADAPETVEDAISVLKQTLDANEVKIETIAAADFSSENVRAAYKLTNAAGTQLGTTIEIFKDQTLKAVEYANQILTFTYILADGTEDDVEINISELITEAEYEKGLEVNDHKLSVKIDENSESFLTVSTDGVKLDGVQDAIDAAVEALDVAEITEEGKAIVAVSETDGKIAATTGVIKAQYVSFDNTAAKFGREGAPTTVEDAVSTLKDELDAFKEEVGNVAYNNGVIKEDVDGTETVHGVVKTGDPLITVDADGFQINPALLDASGNIILDGGTY